LATESADSDATLTDLWHSIFKERLANEDFELAYMCLAEMQDARLRNSSVTDLITTMCERNKVEMLLSFNFVGFQDEVEAELSFKARTSNPLQRPVYSKIYYSWSIKRGDYRGAASTMYQRARILGLMEKPDNDARHLHLSVQLEAYALAINALCLLDPQEAWISLPISEDSGMVPEEWRETNFGIYGIDDEKSRDSEIIELSDMRKELELCRARRQLVVEKMSIRGFVEEPDFFISPMEVVRRYAQIGMYDEALYSAKVFEVDMSPIFSAMVDMCMVLSKEGPAASSEKESHWSGREMVVGWEGNKTQKAWRLLQESLDRHDTSSTGWQYRKNCLERIMDQDRTSTPPTWLTAFFQEREPEYLIRTCLRYQLTLAAIDYTILMIKKANQPFAQGSTVSVTQTHLPYALIDAVVLYIHLVPEIRGELKIVPFLSDDACECLSCLKFSQSNRTADPRDPDRIITTTTTTTFSMTRDMAKAMSQHFMDARLIENAIDKASNQFKDRSVYQITPKGLHVLERFISKNGVNADGLVKVFQTQPICMKLLHLERRASDDEIIISQQVVTALFRRFAGRGPNYIDEAASPETADPAVEYNKRAAGIPLTDVVERAPQLVGKGPLQTFKFCFLAVNALEWLCDFTSIVGRDEAAEMAAHFVRFGLITLLSDKRKSSDSAVIFTVRGTATGPNASGATQGEFRCTAKAIYRITEEGRKVARWTEPKSATGRDSPEPALRSLFREFLRGNFCEENLSFWLEVQEFKRKFLITSTAISNRAGPGGRAAPQHAAMEKHHESLIQMAFVIYNTYLAPSSHCELNIDHGLRNDLVAYLNEVMTESTGKAFQGRVDPDQAFTLNATQLQHIIRLYERIQLHVFRLMATDSVPKFIKTKRFLALRSWVEDYEANEGDNIIPSSSYNSPPIPPGLDEPEGEIGRTYMTFSAQANEKAAAAAKEKLQRQIRGET
ncbi:hypothetical protein FRC17_002511, partial [Serendipita sp. 399]